VVQRLLADERVELAGFPHADAFVALYPFPAEGRGAQGRDGPGEGSAARRRGPGRRQGQPGGAQGSAIPRSSTCCSTPRRRSTRARASSTAPTSFPAAEAVDIR